MRCCYCYTVDHSVVLLMLGLVCLEVSSSSIQPIFRAEHVQSSLGVCRWMQFNWNVACHKVPVSAHRSVLSAKVTPVIYPNLKLTFEA